MVLPIKKTVEKTFSGSATASDNAADLINSLLTDNEGISIGDHSFELSPEGYRVYESVFLSYDVIDPVSVDVYNARNTGGSSSINGYGLNRLLSGLPSFSMSTLTSSNDLQGWITTPSIGGQTVGGPFEINGSNSGIVDLADVNPPVAYSVQHQFGPANVDNASLSDFQFESGFSTEIEFKVVYTGRKP
jgi:hypothetical protein